MKTVLIVGSSGLIGSHLVSEMPDFDFDRELYLSSRGTILPKADIIIHAAGYASPGQFMADPIETIRVNTELTIRLLESLNPGGTFLFCSSTEMYHGLSHPAHEDEIGTTTPSHPRSCYIESKRCGEAIVNAYRSKGVRAISARVALAYGPGAKKNDKRAISQFIDSALTTGRIVLKDRGEAVRTLCYVSDTVSMLWDIALRGQQAVYNVGGTSVVSIVELASMIARKTGAELFVPDTDDNPIGAPQDVKIDLTRVREEFGMTDYVSLSDGLDRTIAWHRSLCAK